MNKTNFCFVGLMSAFVSALACASTMALATESPEYPRASLRVFEGFAGDLTAPDVAGINLDCIYQRNGHSLKADIRRSKDLAQGFTAELSYTTESGRSVVFSHQDSIQGDLVLSSSSPSYGPRDGKIVPSWGVALSLGKQGFWLHSVVLDTDETILERKGNRFLMVTGASIGFQEPKFDGNPSSGWRDYDEGPGKCVVTLSVAPTLDEFK